MNNEKEKLKRALSDYQQARRDEANLAKRAKREEQARIKRAKSEKLKREKLKCREEQDLERLIRLQALFRVC